MDNQILSVDHRLNELRQVGDELRAGRHAAQVRKAGRVTDAPSFATSLRDLLARLTGSGAAARLTAH